MTTPKDGVEAYCEWREEDQWGPMAGTYESACGQAWAFTDGGPAENNVRFCQGCGKPVNVIPFPQPPEEADEAGVNPSDGAQPWDASQIKQPGWHDVFAAFVAGAEEARANPAATGHDFTAAADGYTKRVFEEVDPVSEAALRTESWRDPDTGRTTPKPQPCSAEEARERLRLDIEAGTARVNGGVNPSERMSNG